MRAEEEKCGYRDINGPPSEGLEFQAMGRILTDNLSTFVSHAYYHNFHMQLIFIINKVQKVSLKPQELARNSPTDATPDGEKTREFLQPEG